MSCKEGIRQVVSEQLFILSLKLCQECLGNSASLTGRYPLMPLHNFEYTGYEYWLEF